MDRKTKRGCLGAAVLVLLLVLAGGFSVIYFGTKVARDKAEEFSQRAEERRLREMEEAQRWAKSREDGTVELFQDRLPRFEPLKPGDAVELERFMVWMLDDEATDLARSAFLESVEGSPVEWELIVGEVSEKQGRLVAELSRPYMIHIVRGGGTHGSVISVSAEFEASSREDLIRLRRGDRVRIAGQLSVSQKQPVIQKARVVTP